MGGHFHQNKEWGGGGGGEERPLVSWGQASRLRNASEEPPGEGLEGLASGPQSPRTSSYHMFIRNLGPSLSCIPTPTFQPSGIGLGKYMPLDSKAVGSLA